MEIKVEELPISYVEGKVLEQNKDTLVQNLDLSWTLAARVLKTGRLSDEINLLETTHEVNSGLHDLAGLLLNVDVKDEASNKKAWDWANSASDLANGSVNNLYLDTLTYVTAHSDEVEAMQCASSR